MTDSFQILAYYFDAVNPSGWNSMLQGPWTADGYMSRQENSCFLMNRMLRYRDHKNRPYPETSQLISCVYSLFSNVHFNIIFSFIFRSQKRSLAGTQSGYMTIHVHVQSFTATPSCSAVRLESQGNPERHITDIIMYTLWLRFESGTSEYKYDAL